MRKWVIIANFALICFVVTPFSGAEEGETIETTLIADDTSADEQQPVAGSVNPPQDIAVQQLREIESTIKNINQNNIRLRNVMQEINTPLTGVEEVIRREKMRLLRERIDTNISRVQQIRNEQQRYQGLVDQQKNIINQQKLLEQQRSIRRQNDIAQQQRNLPKT